MCYTHEQPVARQRPVPVCIRSALRCVGGGRVMSRCPCQSLRGPPIRLHSGIKHLPVRPPARALGTNLHVAQLFFFFSFFHSPHLAFTRRRPRLGKGRHKSEPTRGLKKSERICTYSAVLAYS